jgi:uncharacterized protein
VSENSILMQGAILIFVAIAITVGVYGVVALIVKMDDIGLNLAQRGSAAVRAVGEALVSAMPILLSGLAAIGTAAMIWVGGGIILHGIEEFGFTTLPHFVHHLAEEAGHAVPAVGGLIEWLVGAIGSGIFGAILGGLIVVVHHQIAHRKGH